MNRDFSLKKLSNSELNQKIKNLFQEERRLTKVMVLHIAEVDSRKLYLEMAYPSLFEYLILEIGYTNGSAQRRIDAARLLQRVPDIATKIEEGKLSLAQISKVQQAFREVRKKAGISIDAQTQKSIVKQIEGQSPRQTELILAQNFQIEIKTETKTKIQKDESVRMEITFSKEEMEVVKQFQALMGHKTEGGNLKDCLLSVMKAVINKRTQSPRSTATMAVKKFILQRDKTCQYKDPKTGRQCNSNHFLEIDHIQPRWAEGGKQKENLRLLCRNHNQFRYQMGR